MTHISAAPHAGQQSYLHSAEPSGQYLRVSSSGTKSLAGTQVADAEDLRACLDAGYAGASVGTRFLASPEAQVTESYKKGIVAAAADDLGLGAYSGADAAPGDQLPRWLAWREAAGRSAAAGRSVQPSAAHCLGWLSQEAPPGYRDQVHFESEAEGMQVEHPQMRSQPPNATAGPPQPVDDQQ